jgi:hypothetical protein
MSSARASAKQAAEILALVNETGWNRDEVQRRIIGRWGLLRDIAVALDDPQLSEEQVRAMHPLFYKKTTFQSLLLACRQYWVSPSFNETNYPLEPVAPDEDEWEVYKYHFETKVKSEEIFLRLEEMGYRLLGGSRRAMEFIAENHDLQLDHPFVITARWQAPDGIWCAPIAVHDGAKHLLGLLNLKGEFDSLFGWLVLRRKAA